MAKIAIYILEYIPKIITSKSFSLVDCLNIESKLFLMKFAALYAGIIINFFIISFSFLLFSHLNILLIMPKNLLRESKTVSISTL